MGTGTAAPVVLLMGPTATGKTELAVALHERLPVDVISVDSAMVYRGMDIGTAKPGPALLARCPHRLIDICDPAEAYSAGRFVTDASREIERSHRAGRVPLLVGGTMLYFRALQQGLAELPRADEALRARIDAEAGRRGWAALHAELARLDPVAAARIQPGDSQRIQRALEVCRLSGQPMSELQARARPAAPDRRFLKIGLWPADRTALRRRIAARFERMIRAGLVAEVAALRERPGLSVELPSMRAVGYRQIWLHLDGEYALETAVERAVIATGQLAKRQTTWLRRERDLRRLDPSHAGLVDAVAASIGEIIDGVRAVL
jgi:tRNA dimethylallyltransferase